MSVVLDRLRKNLVVSCQPVPEGPLDKPEIVAAFALAALDGGAVGLRIEGIANMVAVRRVTDVPIIGLIKVDREDTPIRISPLAEHVRGLIGAGADIVAVDATDRVRPEPLADLLAEIHAGGALAMADCATIADGQNARDLGFDILGSTMSGYTGGPIPHEPDFALLRALAGLGRFVIAEGRYHTPAQAAEAIRAGADAVVVGSAITRPEHVTTWFADAIHNAGAAL